MLNMTREEKKKDLEEMFAITEDFNDLERAQIIGILQGMNMNKALYAAAELRKKEAS